MPLLRYSYPEKLYPEKLLVPIPTAVVLLMLFLTPLLSGCRSVLRPEIPLQVDLQDVIPSHWDPTTELQPISIDGDADIEYMLFYRYDQGLPTDGAARAGPVGAVIYDLQIDSGMVLGPEPKELVPVPNQPSGFYVPYRILPNYWPATGNRFHAVPGAAFFPVGYYIAEPKDADNIRVVQIQRDAAIINTDDPNSINDEMIIYGGDTHITATWWENAYDGYGVAHLYAPGGFRNFEWTGATEVSPIESVEGAFPLHDRSRLCRNFLYTRAKDEENKVKAPDTTKTAARYVVSELGIDFCDGTPRHPFYPEGVVLAYLLEPGERVELVQPKGDGKLADINKAIGFDKITKNKERIQNLRTPSIIPYPPRQEGAVRFDLETPVCVELVSADNIRRQLDFILRYIPPTLSQSGATGDILTDEMVIVDVTPQDMSVDKRSCWDRIVGQPPSSEEFPPSE